MKKEIYTNIKQLRTVKGIKAYLYAKFQEQMTKFGWLYHEWFMGEFIGEKTTQIEAVKSQWEIIKEIIQMLMAIEQLEIEKFDEYTLQQLQAEYSECVELSPIPNKRELLLFKFFQMNVDNIQQEDKFKI
jgi:hypothetical protein